MVELWLNHCKPNIEPNISETYRSPERQEWLYAQNLSSVKTYGAHYFGVAVDFYFTENGKTAYPAAKMKAAADIAKKHGFTWGGDWPKLHDTPHLEMLGGISLAAYRQGKRPPWYNSITNITPIIPKDDDDDMISQEQFNDLANNWIRTLGELKPSDWNEKYQTWQKAKDQGIFDGTAPQGFITREQTAIVLQRLGLIK